MPNSAQYSSAELRSRRPQASGGRKFSMRMRAENAGCAPLQPLSTSTEQRKEPSRRQAMTIPEHPLCSVRCLSPFSVIRSPGCTRLSCSARTCSCSFFAVCSGNFLTSSSLRSPLATKNAIRFSKDARADSLAQAANASNAAAKLVSSVVSVAGAISSASMAQRSNRRFKACFDPPFQGIVFLFLFGSKSLVFLITCNCPNTKSVRRVAGAA